MIIAIPITLMFAFWRSLMARQIYLFVWAYRAGTNGTARLERTAEQSRLFP